MTHEWMPVHTDAIRIVILWQSMTGYLNACLKALARSPGVSIAIAYEGAVSDAPFDSAQFSWLTASYEWHHAPNTATLQNFVRDARPDVVVVSSWHIGAYRSVLRELGRSGVPRILCMDNQWLGTLKQWLGRLTWRQHIRPYYDLAFVPGDRQVHFARRLGFRHEHVMRGLYSADTAAFARPMSTPVNRGDDAFLFVGRLTPEKGVRVLAQAYAGYRRTVNNPWPLFIAGIGPESSAICHVDGVRMFGFVQPADLPELMWGTSALVCPSLFEPWGVVVHEAAAAGLILLCSEAVGAGVHLVQDGYNGFTLPTGGVRELTNAFAAVTRMSAGRRNEMSRASVALSAQFSPDRWARYLLEMLHWGVGRTMDA